VTTACWWCHQQPPIPMPAEMMIAQASRTRMSTPRCSCFALATIGFLPFACRSERATGNRKSDQSAPPTVRVAACAGQSLLPCHCGASLERETAPTLALPGAASQSPSRQLRRQSHVPTAPEISDACCPIRHVEIVGEVKPEHQAKPDRHLRIGRKIEEQLKGEGKAASQASLIARVCGP
jgi:hypothetical protein